MYFKTVKLMLGALKSLNFSKLLGIFLIGLKRPLFSLLTVFATLKTFTLAEKFYPRNHSGNSNGNAFRHALWSCMIMMYCCKISSVEKSAGWAEFITSYHEKLFVNNPLQTAMDLHNNRVGINCFLFLTGEIHRQFFEVSFFVNHLHELSQNAEYYSVTVSKEVLVILPP